MISKFRASGSPVDIRPDAKPGMTYFYDVPTSMLSPLLERYLAPEDKEAVADVTREEEAPAAEETSETGKPGEKEAPAADKKTKEFFSPESAGTLAKSIRNKAELLLTQVDAGLALIREGRSEIIEKVIPSVEAIYSDPIKSVAATGSRPYGITHARGESTDIKGRWDTKINEGTTYARKLYNMFNHLAGSSSDKPGEAMEGDAYFHAVMTNDSGYGGKFFAEQPSLKHKEASVTVSEKMIGALDSIFEPMLNRVESARSVLARNKVLDTLEKHLKAGEPGPKALLEGMTGRHGLEEMRFLIGKLRDLSETEMPNVVKALDRRLRSMLAIASGKRDDNAEARKETVGKTASAILKEAGEILSYIEYLPEDRLLISSRIRELADTLNQHFASEGK
jgi:hypothetical protein